MTALPPREPPIEGPPRRSPRRLGAIALIGLLTLAGGGALVGAGILGDRPSFSPHGPCLADGREPGAYPELEALVPSRFDGRPPERLDSGRSCSRENLASLAEAGISELRFAGGLWATGAESGVTLAVFVASGLTVDDLGAWYEAGARSARKTSNVVVSRPDAGRGAAYRIDLENGGQLQTIVVLPAELADAVRVVLVGSAARDVGSPEGHAAIVERAIAATLAVEATAPSPN